MITYPNYAKIRTLVDKSVIIDTAADFQPLQHTAKFRNLQIRILQVYRKAAEGKLARNKFFCSEYRILQQRSMTAANAYHLQPEPEKIVLFKL